MSAAAFLLLFLLQKKVKTKKKAGAVTCELKHCVYFQHKNSPEFFILKNSC